MKCTFSNRDPVAACGFHRKPEIRSYTIIRPGKAWATSPQSVCEMASFCCVARPGDSMESPSGSSSRCFARLALFPAVAYSPSVTMRSIIAPHSICLGVINRLHNFRLDFLPPYSPELNPIERVWKLTRRLCLHNRYFGFLDGVVSAVEDQFAEWTKSNDILRRLCAIT